MKHTIRFAFTLTALVAATFTMASFEMMLVGDSGTHKIHRYDAETGIYLGSFGNAISGIQDIAANAATGACYVLGYGQVGGWNIQSYNFHTGRFLGEFSLGSLNAGKLSLATNGELLVGASDAVYRYTPAGATVGVPLKYVDNNFSYRSGGAVQHSSGNYYVFGDGNAVWPNDYVMALNASSAWQGNYQIPGPSASAAIVDGIVSGDKFISLQQTSANPGTYNGQVLNKSGASAGLTLQYTFSLFSDAGQASVEFAHSNQLMYLNYGFSDANQPSGIMYRTAGISTGSFSVGNEYLMPQVGVMAGSSMVLAPEPGTMVALGLGVSALISRRRRK